MVGTLFPDAHPGAVRKGRTMDTDLTAAELRVLRHIIGGLTTDEIADALGRSGGVVRFHTKNIMTKFGVDNRVRVAVHALRKGIVK